MPSTINGIGTHYYGKKNVESRSSVCQSCRREGLLSSYDTRLWFVILFVPIIPMGRKRIIDYCPACSRHFVMDLDKWEAAKQLEISGALDRYRSNPTPEAAIEVHNRLLQFHQYEQAVVFRRDMCERFADNAKIQVHVAQVLVHLGKHTEAEPYFSRALALRPDLPEARAGAALLHIRAGRLDEARPLLDFLEKPGAVQLYSLVPLEELARAYQRANRHRDALDLFRKLLDAIPTAAQHAGFRKQVEQIGRAHV